MVSGNWSVQVILCSAILPSLLGTLITFGKKIIIINKYKHSTCLKYLAASEVISSHNSCIAVVPPTLRDNHCCSPVCFSESETQADNQHSVLEAKRSISLVQDSACADYEDPLAVAFNIVRQVLYGSRDNINFVHEIFRQAFLLPFTCSPAIRRVIAVYKEWIQSAGAPASLPVFMLEPLDPVESPTSPDEHSLSARSRLRNHSYIGAIHSENVLVRAGLQNVLQVNP